MCTLRIIAFLLTLGLSGKLSAQYSDVQAWSNLYIEKRLIRGLNAHVEAQGRINQNISNFYYSSIDVGLTFKPLKWLNLSAAYVISGKELKRGGVNYRNQYYASALLKFKFETIGLDWLRINNRIMVQSKNNDSYLAKEFVEYRDNYFRDKLSVKIDLTRRLTPYVAQEFYWQINDPGGNDIHRSRSFAGIEFLVTRNSQFEIYYLLQQELNQKRPDLANVIGVGYEIYFK